MKLSDESGNVEIERLLLQREQKLISTFYLILQALEEYIIVRFSSKATEIAWIWPPRLGYVNPVLKSSYETIPKINTVHYNCTFQDGCAFNMSRTKPCGISP